MKRLIVVGKQIMLAAVLFAGLSLSSCSKDEDPKPNVPVVPSGTENNGGNTNGDNTGNNGNTGDNTGNNGGDNTGNNGGDNTGNNGGDNTGNSGATEEGNYKIDLSEGSTEFWQQFCDVTYNEDGSVTLVMSTGDADWKKGEFGFIIPDVSTTKYTKFIITYKDATEQSNPQVGACIHYGTTTAGWVSGESDNKQKFSIESEGTLEIEPAESGDMQTMRIFDFATGNSITIVSVEAVAGENPNGGAESDDNENGEAPEVENATLINADLGNDGLAYGSALVEGKKFNIGFDPAEGDEIVICYDSDGDPDFAVVGLTASFTLSDPIPSWADVELESGEKKQVSITLTADDAALLKASGVWTGLIISGSNAKITAVYKKN